MAKISVIFVIILLTRTQAVEDVLDVEGKKSFLSFQFTLPHVPFSVKRWIKNYDKQKNVHLLCLEKRVCGLFYGIKSCSYVVCDKFNSRLKWQ